MGRKALFFKIRDSEEFRIKRRILARAWSINESDAVRRAVGDAVEKLTRLDMSWLEGPGEIEINGHKVMVQGNTIRVVVLTGAQKCDYCNVLLPVGGQYILTGVGKANIRRWCGCGGDKLDRQSEGDPTVVPGHVHEAEGGSREGER